MAKLSSEIIMSSYALALVVTVMALRSAAVHAADPDIATDFVVPFGVNASTLDGSFFASNLLREVMTSEGAFATVIPVNAKVFPALEGLGVSFAMLQFPPKSLNPVHIHPHGSELLYIAEGSLCVGFIDANNKLFAYSLKKGDLFVFPKGLVHYQINTDKHHTAQALAGFSSSNPGVIKLPSNLFKSGISTKVLEKSFGVSADVIKNLIGV